jgi:hypothetical protein
MKFSVRIRRECSAVVDVDNETVTTPQEAMEFVENMIGCSGEISVPVEFETGPITDDSQWDVYDENDNPLILYGNDVSE